MMPWAQPSRGSESGANTCFDDYLIRRGERVRRRGDLEHRNYAAGVLGRFISRDPIGHAGNLGLNAYAENNPISRIDSEGPGWLGVNASVQVSGDGSFTVQPTASWITAPFPALDWFTGTTKVPFDFVLKSHDQRDELYIRDLEIDYPVYGAPEPNKDDYCE